jgi:predicted dinucleotide-binding enzyme
MQVGIIGAGFIARAVAAVATAVGYNVMVSNTRGPDSRTAGLWITPESRADRAGADEATWLQLTDRDFPVNAIAGGERRPLS